MKKVISTTNAPAAIGPYSQAIEANGFVFASGQIPVNPATGEVAEGIEGQAEQVNPPGDGDVHAHECEEPAPGRHAVGIGISLSCFFV